MSTTENAITSRMSVRSFTTQEIPHEKIHKLFNIAKRAPSGNNIQPWKVYVLEGQKLEKLCQIVCEAYDSITLNPELINEYQPEYDYYPTKWFSPYVDRRRENGWGLYGVLGITKDEKEKMRSQQRKNFEFFGAPIGLFFTIDKSLNTGSMLDYGMFLQNVMIVARDEGLDTCPQASWNGYAKLILPFIEAGDNEMLVCGMALGYADKTDKINSFVTPRVGLNEFIKWV